PHFREATWEEALDLVARKLTGIYAENGPSAIAGFGSAKCSNEEAYLFQKLIRTGFHTNNVDHCTRLCHASSVAALFEGIGSGAVSTTYGDIANAGVAIVTGSNSTANHPVASSFFKQARRNGTTIIYIDPRADKMADHADIYCQLKPGTDVAFYNGLMHEIIRLGLTDDEYIANRTSNFEALKNTVADYPPERAEQITGIPADTITRVARAWGEAKAGIIFWGMGISQHTTGTDNARCLIALCSITGNVGKPGSGLHPLRGQNNVQGASDMGLIPMFYPDYQKADNPEVKARFESAWGTTDLDPKKGLTVTEIIGSALKGGVKGMYMLGENPFLSDPNINKVRKALAKLDFLVVQDIFLTETAEFADVILPASSYLEKDGTYTNTDRRVQLGRKVLDPPGQARVDWEVVQDIANRIGLDWRYESPRQIFDEMVSVIPSYTNLTYDNLGLSGKLYPNPDPEHSDGTVVMFGEKFNTNDGLAHLVPAEWLPARELPDEMYPFVLNTGRMLEHWHTGSMTRRSYALDAIAPKALVYIHPADAAQLGIKDGEMARVSSRRGVIELEAKVSHREAPGNCFIPFHFREAAANLLTIDEIDPFGKIPEFKFCAVRIERADG
ncbi:MAG TPA: formate dehydrogenase subunit alpha, partial [Trebonia sp.]